jgi:glycosyltransferase involved in cell wall biosynthesis
VRIAALIPALDSAGTIADVVRGARAVVEQVLVVDDGSQDQTAAHASGAGAEVLRHSANRGKGAALRSGLVWLCREGFTHAFSLDADGQHLASEMPAMIAEAREFPSAIHVGRRELGHDQEVAPIKKFGNDFANWWVSLAAGQKLSDTQSGFRIYPIEATLNLGVQSDRYDFESEVLILAARRGIEIRCQEIRVFYPPPGERQSHYRPWEDTIRIILTVVPFLAGLRR